MPISNRIQNAYAKSLVLLSELAETQDAITAHAAAARQVSEIEKDVAASYAVVERLGVYTQLRLRGRRRSSVAKLKRLTSRLGKEKENAQVPGVKGEQEYLDAVEKETKARTQHEENVLRLSDAMATTDELALGADRHLKLLEELDALYDIVFRELSPDLSEVDSKLQALKPIVVVYDGLKSKSDVELHIIGVLREADRILRQAELRAKLCSSQFGLNSMAASGGGAVAGNSNNFIGLDEVSVWLGAASRADKLLDQALQMSPLEQSGNLIRVTRKDGSGDRVFDTISYPLMRPEERLESSNSVIAQARLGIEDRIQSAEEREAKISKELSAVTVKRQEASKELQQSKHAVLERLAEVSI